MEVEAVHSHWAGADGDSFLCATAYPCCASQSQAPCATDPVPPIKDATDETARGTRKQADVACARMDASNARRDGRRANKQTRKQANKQTNKRAVPAHLSNAERLLRRLDLPQAQRVNEGTAGMKSNRATRVLQALDGAEGTKDTGD